ncbi:MAG: hypothetical protein K9N09_04020 [Candidatus Cloacimonetes bacterium]|nr:hypothetical protein [Candidatus Cloacimonadota bacterium]MCF7813356.1 hypothetical protein [Candidatus Cloacimonadota bacterium]MCF7867845.1 hypothetical protein [Candidatus Cloacimonadota bacterium]MCF7883269.1 hypothetical protein [Candidatus Cloacimonadota bacterium]
MLKYFLLFYLLFSLNFLFSDPYIARGSDIGEIYFVGYVQPDGVGIYRSTNYGETAELKDGSGNIECIGADLTSGSVYYSQIYGAMYFSNNYGATGSWVYRENEINTIYSGRIAGEIFDGPERHSTDYGVSFISHENYGYFGSPIEAEIDCQENVGYMATVDACPDSVYLFISYDNYNNFELQHVFDLHCYTDMDLTRGVNDGELYLYTKNMNFGTGKHLYYSSDYGNTWELKNTFNSPNLPI